MIEPVTVSPKRQKSHARDNEAPETLSDKDSSTPQTLQTFSDQTNNKSVVASKTSTNINNLDFSTFVPKTVVEVDKPVIKDEPPAKDFKFPRMDDLRQMRVNLNDAGLLAIAKKRFEEGKLAKLVKTWLDYAKKAKNIQHPTASLADCLRKEWHTDGHHVEPGLPEAVKPPSEEQVAKLQELKDKGEIADYYFSSQDGVTKVIPFVDFFNSRETVRIAYPSRAVPWWEILIKEKK
ncbi:hypothetical protein NIES4071_109900 (plasmid) [Calothrix sp. NIES-4071]|nr:hypothetical protein NIES4071_109900 [Calothrix sp. NIES-4071]BAZ65245.1 hypothetical protein NIES4105_109780 [Calothrix sp. NIES-4105]